MIPPKSIQHQVGNQNLLLRAQLLDGSFVLNVDCVQAGVGGTDTWSIMARPEVHHRLLDKAYSYSFTIRPVKDFKDAVNAARNR